jgi:hypothetical protein
MTTLKVGDRVSINKTEVTQLRGREGVVVSIDELSWPVGVRLEYSDGSFTNGTMQFDPSELDLLDEDYHTEPPC